MKLKMKKMVYATTFFAIAILSLTFAFAAILPLTIHTEGTYDTAMNITVDPTTIDWGQVEIGVSVIRTANITNEGGTNVDSLHFTTATYTGISAVDFTLTCDLEGSPLTVMDSEIATFTFTLVNPVSATFNFDIVVNE